VTPAPLSAAGRFAPSPTGTLHLGNLRTALLAWLYARSQGAPFLVRIEDLDAGRSRERFVAEQLDDLRTLGLDWDGEPVRQSARSHLYDAAIARLDAAGLLYPCFCTRAEIRAAASAPHGGAPHYPGTCRTLTPAERAKREAVGRPPALRVDAGGAQVTVHDRNHGDVTGAVDDMIVRRNDGGHAYNLAVVVDDAEQAVGEVVRGDDLLEATPGQVWLQRALGLPTPAYAHVPLLLGDDGQRLAKRHGAVTLHERLAGGESAAQVRATLVRSAGIPLPGDAPGTLTAILPHFDPALLAAC
jgi:glutamyl-tRNA synthetase